MAEYCNECWNEINGERLFEGECQVFDKGATCGRQAVYAPRSGKKGGVGGNFEVPPSFWFFLYKKNNIYSHS